MCWPLALPPVQLRGALFTGILPSVTDVYSRLIDNIFNRAILTRI
jgi:hypothetical protein